MADWPAIRLAAFRFLLALHVLPGGSGLARATDDASDARLSEGERREQLRKRTVEMLSHAWSSYERHAWGSDEVLPQSCKASNPHGGIGVFLVDGLTTLALLGERDALKRAITWLVRRGRERPRLFDVSHRASVFEVNIRVLGGLLSTHELLVASPMLAPEGRYSGELLELAEELGTRLIPAFWTKTGIPRSWVNLRSGLISKDTRETCTACAGTLLLEFGTLSRLTGNETFERLARDALQEVYKRRSARLGLVGSTLDTNTGRWMRRDSSIGANVDSFYEYLLKSYFVFGDPQLLEWFSESYNAAMVSMRENVSRPDGAYWLVDVNMDSGQKASQYVSSLGAYWPGMQAYMGHAQDADGLFKSFQAVRQKFGFLPEVFDPRTLAVHPTMHGHPLRPEHVESAFLMQFVLNGGQNGTSFLDEVASVQRNLNGVSRERCGFASIQDVATNNLSDSMESFFVAETCLYLWLFFSGERPLMDYFVLSTEGHPMEIFQEEGKSPQHLPDVPGEVPEQCVLVCASSRAVPDEIAQEAKESRALRNLGIASGSLEPHRALLLRRRRCIACAHVAQRRPVMAAARAAADRQRKLRDKPSSAASVASGPTATSDPRLACILEERPNGLFECARLALISSATPAQLWPPLALVIEIVPQPGDQSHGHTAELKASRAHLDVDTLPSETIGGSDATCKIAVEPLVLLPETMGRCDATEAPLEGGASARQDGAFAASATTALFGPALPRREDGRSLVGPLEVAAPTLACGELQNPPEQFRGAWVLAQRGSCTFLAKVLQCQALGALGVIIVDGIDDLGDERKPKVSRMIGDGIHDGEVEIPSIMVSHEVGQRLQRERASGRITVEVVRNQAFALQISAAPGSMPKIAELVSRGKLDWAKAFSSLPVGSVQRMMQGATHFMRMQDGRQVAQQDTPLGDRNGHAGDGRGNRENGDDEAPYFGCYMENSGVYVRQDSPRWCSSMSDCQCPPEYPYVGYTNGDGNKAEWSCLPDLPSVAASGCKAIEAWNVGARDWKVSVYANPFFRTPAENGGESWAVSTHAAVVRAGPRTDAAKLRYLRRGEVVRGIRFGDWLKLSDEDGMGWVLIDLKRPGLGAFLVPHRPSDGTAGKVNVDSGTAGTSSRR